MSEVFRRTSNIFFVVFSTSVLRYSQKAFRGPYIAKLNMLLRKSPVLFFRMKVYKIWRKNGAKLSSSMHIKLLPKVDFSSNFSDTN